MTNIEKFLETMKALRAKDGCPWDREQTLKSLKPYLIEESYEVLEAIDNNDIEGHKEELGDILLQVVFQAQIRTEAGEFTFEDVAKSINDKMIFRHPHVFGDDKTIKTSEDILNKWDDFKKKEGKKITFFKKLPKGMPALLESLSINKKAAKTGFDWDTIDDIYKKLDEEVLEFQEAITEAEKLDELGDILFVIVNLARRFNIDPEEALKKSNKKFKNRFLDMLKLSQKREIEFETLTKKEMNNLWNEIKNK